jgi:hypothetical protein
MIGGLKPLSLPTSFAGWQMEPRSAFLMVAVAFKPRTGVWTFFSYALAEPDEASDSALPEGGSRIAHPFKGGMVEERSKSRRDD